MSTRKGKVIIPADANPWPHERRVAQILARAGYRVEFIPESNIKTPDIYLEQTAYEIKSPISKKINAIERNLTRALEKCPNVILDGSRTKIRKNQILHELIKGIKRNKGLKRIIFIDKNENIIDINELI